MGIALAAGVADLSGYNWLPTLSKEYRIVLRRAAILSAISNTNPRKMARGMGDTIRIPIKPQVRSTRGAVGYTNTWQSVAPTGIDLVIDRLRHWDFPVYDAQDVQSQIQGYADNWAKDAGVNTNEDIEEEVFGEIFSSTLADSHNRGATAGAKTASINLGTSDAPRTISASEGTTFVVDALLETGVVLDEQDVGDSNRFWVVPPLLYARLKSALRAAQEMGDAKSILRGRTVGSLDGYQVYVSNRLPTYDAVGGKPVLPVIFGSRDALAFHIQSSDMEKVRLTTTMADGLRAEILYGFKMILDTAIGTAFFTIV